jgi:hypothetical protein
MKHCHVTKIVETSDLRQFVIAYDSGDKDFRWARLVACGFQQKGLQYDDIYAPVAELQTFRILLAASVNLDWTIYQMDVVLRQNKFKACDGMQLCFLK